MENNESWAVGLKLLRAPVEPHHISKKPVPTRQQTDDLKANVSLGIRCKECGGWHHKNVQHLDYMGHAAVTDRLLDADPLWNWDWIAKDDHGNPIYDAVGGLWITLTVCGVTRKAYGAAEGKKGPDAIKEIIGDALRNGAMRFGVGLELWHKGVLHMGNDDDGSVQIEESLAPSWIKKMQATKTEHEAQMVWEAGAKALEKRVQDFKEFEGAASAHFAQWPAPGAAK